MKLFIAKSLILILIGSSALYSCKSTEEVQYESVFTNIRFGDGGGFAGRYANYLLSNNGQLVRIENKDFDFLRYADVSKEELREVDSLVLQIINSGLEQKITGNMTYYIEISTQENEYKYSWPDDISNAKKELAALYSKLSEFQNRTLRE